MSRLRRIRRKNRVTALMTPATREVRPSLVNSQVRGLRLFSRNLKLGRNREDKRLRIVVPDKNNELRLDLNRDIKHLKFIHDYNKVRSQYSKQAVKPVATIQPDMSVKVDLPPEHPICVKRQERRELLFATGRAGKGGQRPRRQNNDIKLRCK